MGILEFNEFNVTQNYSSGTGDANNAVESPSSPNQNAINDGDGDKKKKASDNGSGQGNQGDRGIDEEKNKELEEQYPNKKDKFEKHHVDPKYIGHPEDGDKVNIPAPYHQGITNEWRKECMPPVNTH